MIFSFVCVCVSTCACVCVYIRLCKIMYETSLAQSHSSVLPNNALQDSLVNSHSMVGSYWTYLINLVWYKATIIEHKTDQTDFIKKSFWVVIADYRSMVTPGHTSFLTFPLSAVTKVIHILLFSMFFFIIIVYFELSDIFF